MNAPGSPRAQDRLGGAQRRPCGEDVVHEQEPLSSPSPPRPRPQGAERRAPPCLSVEPDLRGPAAASEQGAAGATQSLAHGEGQGLAEGAAEPEASPEGARDRHDGIDRTRRAPGQDATLRQPRAEGWNQLLRPSPLRPEDQVAEGAGVGAELRDPELTAEVRSDRGGRGTPAGSPALAAEQVPGGGRGAPGLDGADPGAEGASGGEEQLTQLAEDRRCAPLPQEPQKGDLDPAERESGVGRGRVIFGRKPRRARWMRSSRFARLPGSVAV